MRKVKIEYDPSFSQCRFLIFKKDGWLSRWERIGMFESLESAQTHANELLKYPIYLNNARSGEL